MGRARILVADDNLAILEMFSALLRNAGFDVVAVANGTDAAAALEAGGIDVSVMDVRMPGGGPASLISIRKRYPDVKLLVCSGLMTEVEAGRFQRLGVDAVLEKTSASEALVDTIRKLLAN